MIYLSDIYQLAKIELSIIFIAAFIACQNDEEMPIDKYYQGENQQTVLLYFPWSGNGSDAGIYKDIQHNISEIDAAIVKGRGMDGTSFLCFSAISPDSAFLYQIKYNKRTLQCDYDTIKTYVNLDYTSPDGVRQVMSDMKTFAPATNYGMVIGCHGMGWTLKSSIFKERRKYFGGITYEDDNGTRTITEKYVTDINDFVKGVADANVKFEYIVFDDCYMANVEVVFDMQAITRFFIASTSEIVSRGLPYSMIFNYLVATPDYEAIVNGFCDFYSSYYAPYGALAAIDCSQINKMAELVNLINANADYDNLDIEKLQKLDGYKPTIFFDFADYVRNICQDNLLLQKFEQQLKLLVPYAKSTPYLYSMQLRSAYLVKSFSGLTISEPSKNALAANYYSTNWFIATHNL